MFLLVYFLKEMDRNDVEFFDQIESVVIVNVETNYKHEDNRNNEVQRR